MMAVSFAMIVFATLFLLGYFTVERIYTKKHCREHQRIWNAKKTNAIARGEDIYDAYMDYLDYLLAHQHPLYGACFPKF